MLIESRKFAVLGNPVEHSLSPVIHQHFARQFGHDIEYSRQRLETESFAQYVQDFFAAGGGGLNVTVPFKLLAHGCADSLHASAQQAGAANTLALRENGIRAWNTDGAGLVNDLIGRCNLALAAKKILILGAGGAAQGIIGPILECGPMSVTVANRTQAKADKLLSRVAPRYPEVDLYADSLQGLATGKRTFDLIINSTSLGLDGSQVSVATGIAAGAFCYDLSYGESAVFAQWARRAGASGVADGLGMLVEQAALSYEIWLGVKPETATVYQRVAEQLDSSD